MTLRLFNTRTRQIEALTPIDPGCVRMYCCGPTVYAYAHIGNLRTYVFEDVLRRTLELFGHEVQHVMNITDVGHLQSDADVGDDKMEVAARREGQSPWEIARYYEAEFLRHTEMMRILRPTIICRATEHIDEMIATVARLIERGHAIRPGRSGLGHLVRGGIVDQYTGAVVSVLTQGCYAREYGAVDRRKHGGADAKPRKAADDAIAHFPLSSAVEALVIAACPFAFPIGAAVRRQAWLRRAPSLRWSTDFPPQYVRIPPVRF